MVDILIIIVCFAVLFVLNFALRKCNFTITRSSNILLENVVGLYCIKKFVESIILSKPLDSESSIITFGIVASILLLLYMLDSISSFFGSIFWGLIVFFAIMLYPKINNITFSIVIVAVILGILLQPFSIIRTVIYIVLSSVMLINGLSIWQALALFLIIEMLIQCILSKKLLGVIAFAIQLLKIELACIIINILVDNFIKILIGIILYKFIFT